MKLKIGFIIIVSLLFVKIICPQRITGSFRLNNKVNLSKPASTTATNGPVAPGGNGINDILVIGDTVWVGTDLGVSLTTDGGTNWTNFAGTPAFGSESISAEGYYKGVFWAATYHIENASVGPTETGSGLRYTSDNGKSWTKISQPLDSLKDSLITYGNNNLKALPVVVDEENVIFNIAFTPGTVWITSWAGGLRKSTDMGITWQRVLLPPDFLDSIRPTDSLDFCFSVQAGKICNEADNNFLGFSVIAVNDSTLYVGTAGGLNKSTDGGVSWTKFNHVNESNPISGDWVVALAYSQTDSTLWAATRRANDPTEIYAACYSKDGGLNWQTTLSNQTIENLAIRSTAEQNDELIAATDDGAFRTTDYGANWILPNSITDALTGISIKTPTFYSAAFQGNTIWLGSADGLAKINESGGLWNGTWKVFMASQPLTSSSETYAYPNPFNPRTDICKLKYATNGTSVPVTIRIFNFSMQFVRTVIQNAPRGNPTHVIDNSGGAIDTWDGKDDNGNMVPNGVYFYRVDAGSQKPVFGKILVLH
jgi:photosystem II stability/assembly factor-like uncharacterized protein